jgi:hypothetical protein
VIGAAAAITADRSQVPPASGEWTAESDRFCYWLNAVMNDPAGRPRTVVHGHGHGHGQGTLATDGQALTANGGSEVYASNGKLATNQANLHATRAEAS